MKRLVGIVFSLLIILAAVYTFSPRPGPAFPETTARIGTLLMLDAAHAGERLIAVGERGFIFLSDDNGATWKSTPSPTAATLTAVYFVDAQHGWAVGHDAVILVTADGGATWARTHEAPQEQKPLLDVWFADRSHGFAVGAYGSFYESMDGGRSWQTRSVLKDDMHLNAVVGLPSGVLFLAGESGTLFRSADRGRTWKQLRSPYGGSYFGALILVDGGILIHGLRGKIYRSTPEGKDWRAVDSAEPLGVLGGTTLGAGRVVLVGQNGAIWLSYDDGRTFALRKTTERKTLAAVLPITPDTLLAFGEGGVTPVDFAAPK